MAGSGVARESLHRFYQDFLRVCEKWPVDQSRAGRDLGECLRFDIAPKFKEETIDVEF